MHARLVKVGSGTKSEGCPMSTMVSGCKNHSLNCLLLIRIKSHSSLVSLKLEVYTTVNNLDCYRCHESAAGIIVDFD